MLGVKKRPVSLNSYSVWSSILLMQILKHCEALVRRVARKNNRIFRTTVVCSDKKNFLRIKLETTSESESRREIRQ